MQEVKKPRKPLIYYYVIVLLILLLFNFLFMPWAAERRIKEVGYETFMDMTAEENIGQVQINQSDNEIIFTDKDGTLNLEDPKLDVVFKLIISMNGLLIPITGRTIGDIIDLDPSVDDTIQNMYNRNDNVSSGSNRTIGEKISKSKPLNKGETNKSFFDK